MFDHVGLNVRDYAASRTFYEQALAPLGYRVVMAFDEWKAAGFGTMEARTLRVRRFFRPGQLGPWLGRHCRHP